MATRLKPEDIQIRARQNIKDKEKGRKERDQVEELHKNDNVRVKMS